MESRAGKVDDDTHEGLLAVVRACAEQHKADVILHALEVACGANAIGVGSPCAPEHPRADPG